MLQRTADEDETAVEGEDDHRWTKRTQNVLNSIAAKLKASSDGKVVLSSSTVFFYELCVWLVAYRIMWDSFYHKSNVEGKKEHTQHRICSDDDGCWQCVWDVIFCKAPISSLQQEYFTSRKGFEFRSVKRLLLGPFIMLQINGNTRAALFLLGPPRQPQYSLRISCKIAFFQHLVHS